MTLNEELDSLSHWRLCGELTVVQAALLILEVDPSVFLSGRTVLGTGQMEPTEPIEGYEATLSALANEILAGGLPAKIRTHGRAAGGYVDYPPSVGEARGRDVRGTEIIYQLQPSWSLTTISVDELRNWLEKRGVTRGFFFPDRTTTAPEYLDPENKHYAPKLAAAVSAWQAVANDPTLAEGRSVKRAITIWLTNNASRFGLLRSNRRPNELGIEEVAKVANWQSKGGAPKTPNQDLTHPLDGLSVSKTRTVQ